GINAQRYRAVLDATRQALATPLPADGRAWAGFRPLTADGLPAIGPVPGVGGLYVATGHGTLGFTLAPGTGRLLADLVGGRAPRVSADPFRVDRF
ncbi:MAG: FAD-dependent oxidoreductase, partial [Armatimonadota bacterium]|nr:FAD-dependent oxidoreductase [Armatimonadota bacterium]